MRRVAEPAWISMPSRRGWELVTASRVVPDGEGTVCADAEETAAIMRHTIRSR